MLDADSGGFVLQLEFQNVALGLVCTQVRCVRHWGIGL